MKYIILGAGPAGLSFARQLLDMGQESFVILEKGHEVGGLCRSQEVDGAALDVGGGHFLEAGNIRACEFLFRFLPKEEWNIHQRISHIFFQNREIGYPFEAHIWQLDSETQKTFLSSIEQSGCHQKKTMPQGFVDWIEWKFGKKLGEAYMLPYNEKIWGQRNLSQLGTYWLEKLPDVSYEDTLLSCELKSPQGKIPAHKSFYYPKGDGYGRVWREIGKSLTDKVYLNSPVKKIQLPSRVVNEEWQGEYIVTTIPWNVWTQATALPENILQNIKALKHISIQVDYFSPSQLTKAHWVYFPQRELSYHRKLNRCNFLPGSKGYWTETNPVNNAKKAECSFMNEYAYPLNTLNKQQDISKILEWAKGNGIIGLGRWGEWEHYNSDVTLIKGLDLALELEGLNHL